MKNYRGVIKICGLVIFLLLLKAGLFAQDNQSFSIDQSPLPAPTGFINDYVGVIDQATKQRLEERLTNFKNTTNPPIELAVAIVKTTGERPIFDYSLAVARGWKIGAKADDNPSALLFIAIDDRKYFTQVSRDLEDELPDGLVGQLQRQHLVPAFKQNNYGKGVEDTLEAYIRTIGERSSGTVVPVGGGQTNQQPRRPAARSTLSTIGCCAIGLIILLILIFSRSGRSGGGRGGFGGGGGMGGALPWIIGSMIANSGSRDSSNWGGGSGGWGGDSGGWGGFGGGGDFGGGGAGGDW